MSFIKTIQRLFGGKPKPTKEVTISSPSFHLDSFGFNTGFSFMGGLETMPELVSGVQKLKIHTLRFPGGTNSQYYHPDGPGYGVRRDEVIGKAPISIANFLSSDKRETENYVYHFIRLAKLHPEAKIILDLNLVTGNIDEAMMLIDVILSHGLNVYGVELGNELYFPVYRPYFKDVQEYISVCKVYSKAIKSKYPKIKISVCAGNMVEFDVPTGRVINGNTTWNTALAKEYFYDAISIHTYIGKEDGKNNCSSQSNIYQRFNCYKDLLSPVRNNPCGVIVGEAQKLFKEVPIWLSEWNCGKPGAELVNTVLHGMFVLEMLINISENKIELSHFHNISSVGTGYGAIFRNNRQPNMMGTNEMVLSTAYMAFKFFSEVAGERINFPEVPDLIIRVYESHGRGVLLFINKSSENHFLTLVGWKHLKGKCVKGKNLYSVGGRSVVKSDLAEYREFFDNVLPAYSYGVIHYTVDKK